MRSTILLLNRSTSKKTTTAASGIDDVAREVEDFARRAAMPRELGRVVIPVLMKNSAAIVEHVMPDAEVLANQRGQALARDRAHAAGHLLDDDQRRP